MFLIWLIVDKSCVEECCNYAFHSHLIKLIIPIHEFMFKRSIIIEYKLMFNHRRNHEMMMFGINYQIWNWIFYNLDLNVLLEQKQIYFVQIIINILFLLCKSQRYWYLFCESEANVWK
jgi:hypothetical protein